MSRQRTTLQPKDWTVIESRPGFAGLRAIAERDVLPQLADAKPRLSEKNPVNALYGGGCFTAIGGLMLVMVLSSLFGPFGFVVALVIAFFLARPTIARLAKFYVARMVEDLKFRQSVFTPIADHLNLSYIAVPGGGAGLVHQQSQEGLFQSTFSKLYEAFEAYSGQEQAVEVARASGLVKLVTVIHIGTADEATKKARETGLTRLEDGFSGTHGGLAFDAFEVVRSSRRTDDGTTYPAEHALLVVLNLPRTLYGTTQVRSRKIGWHKKGEAERLERVSLESNEFDDAFRVRSNDQVEARFVFTPDVMERMRELAHGDPIRATAQGDHLVVAIEGPNRFDLTSEDTGLDGDAAVRLAIQQIGELFDFVDAVGRVFGLD